MRNPVLSRFHTVCAKARLADTTQGTLAIIITLNDAVPRRASAARLIWRSGLVVVEFLEELSDFVEHALDGVAKSGHDTGRVWGSVLVL